MFIEAKAYMFVGSSRQRLSIKNMPLHEDIRKFAKEIAELTNYIAIDEKKDSRVVLLAKNRLKCSGASPKINGK